MIYTNCFMQNQHKIFNATKSSVISYKSTTWRSTSHKNDGDNEIIDAIDAVAKLKLKLKQKSQKSEIWNRDSGMPGWGIQHSLGIELIMASASAASRMPCQRHASISVKSHAPGQVHAPFGRPLARPRPKVTVWSKSGF